MLSLSINYEEVSEGQMNVIKDILTFTTKQLNIDTKDYNVEISVDDIADGTNGMLFDNMKEKKFTMLIQDDRPLNDIIITMVHEMVHVKQFILDDLEKEIDKGSDMPYLERWWEVEAFSKTNEIIEKYCEMKKNC